MPALAAIRPDGSLLAARPDPEVRERPTRRRFTAAYKRRVLEEADACDAPGQIGALLRREGLYSSQLGAWRRQREAALARGLAPARRGPKSTRSPQAGPMARLESENARLRRELDQARLIIDIQKKLSSILRVDLEHETNHDACAHVRENE